MVGTNHSFSSLLRTDMPDLIVVKCVCHSHHLAAEHSCKTLSRHLDFTVKESHNWFSCSSKRQIEYRTLYNTLANKNPRKIDKLSGTRWLARYEAIIKILEQWEALKLHYQLAQEKERCYTANQFYQMFSENTNKLYLIFLAYILKSLTDVNKSFQSENADILIISTTNYYEFWYYQLDLKKFSIIKKVYQLWIFKIMLWVLILLT